MIVRNVGADRTAQPARELRTRNDALGVGTVDEHVLLTALKAGEEWAFETLVRLYNARLLAVARRFTRNDYDAQDVVQSAYLSAFGALAAFEGASQLSTWLHRIVVNTSLMKIRSRQRKPEESIEALLPALQTGGHHGEQFSDWTLPADQLLEQAETRAPVVFRRCLRPAAGTPRLS